MTDPIDETKLQQIDKERNALQNFFRIATTKVSNNVESAREAIKIRQESIDSKIQDSFRTTMLVVGITVVAAVTDRRHCSRPVCATHHETCRDTGADSEKESIDSL